MYNPANLHCMLPSLNGNTPSLWSYKCTDAAADVDADGYISDAKERGMRLHDIVFVIDTDAATPTCTTHFVAVMNDDGSADLTSAGATHGTNSD